MTEYCSAAAVEPLAGTAKRQQAYVLFEWPGGWSHDVLDGDTFGRELTDALQAALQGRAGLQLIRRPGRAGRQLGTMHRCYLVWPQQSVMELVLLTGPEQILDLDLRGPGRNGGEVIATPLVLVCTHAKRDVCCALRGRPLAAALDDTCGAGVVWETSHTKGHRFAPSMLLMPWGYSFGRLNVEAARALVEAAWEGRYFVPGNRGNGLLTPRGQVAELAVAAQLEGERLRYGDLFVNSDDAAAAVTVCHVDGRSWVVEITPRLVEGVISSCGDAPKTAEVLVATRISGA